MQGEAGSTPSAQTMQDTAGGCLAAAMLPRDGLGTPHDPAAGLPGRLTTTASCSAGLHSPATLPGGPLVRPVLLLLLLLLLLLTQEHVQDAMVLQILQAMEGL